MKNYVSTDELKQIAASLDYITRGIDEQINQDKPTMQIVYALMNISKQLETAIDKAEAEQ